MSAEVIGRTGGLDLVIEGFASIAVSRLQDRRDKTVAELLDA